jgi:membrane associated rhomboid family serine protease
MSSFRNYRGGYRFGWDFSFTPAIKVLLIANTAVFFVEALVGTIWKTPGSDWLLARFGLVPSAVLHGMRIWQPFTYMFMHADVIHILLNMYMLWMFGRSLEQVWGRQRFYKYYFTCGIGAGLINVVVKSIPELYGHAPSDIATIGASGAIFGVLIGNAVLFPERRLMFFPFPITLSMRTAVAIMVALEFVGTLNTGGDNVSHLCHLGGGLVGYLYLHRGSLLYRARNRYSDWKMRRTRRKFDVYMRDHKDEPPPRPDRWVN